MNQAVPKRRIAVVASLTLSLTNFRLQLLKRMAEAGHEVFAFAPERDEEVVRTLEQIGVNFRQIPMARTSLAPMQDLRTVCALWSEFRRLKPDVLFAYTMKPVVYGGIAGRVAGLPRRFALMTGLGYVFTDETPSRKMTAVRAVSVELYRLALKGANCVFVYNEGDEADIRRYRFISGSTRLERVPGSGVDLEHYRVSRLPTNPIRFLLVARLLKAKGIAEYAQAARRLRHRYPDLKFQLLGPHDRNPDSISEIELQSWVTDGTIDYLGETRDVRPYIEECTVFVLPSYREGIPRAVLEAMAMGRPIVTTDTPGCRSTVEDGENGFLVPSRNTDKLAEAMERFVKDPELAARLGARSYELVRERFDVHTVNATIMKSMGLI